MFVLDLSVCVRFTCLCVRVCVWVEGVEDEGRWDDVCVCMCGVTCGCVERESYLPPVN